MHNRKSDPGSIVRSLAMVTQLSVTLLTPVLLCTLLGVFLDRKAGTRYLALAGLLLGILAGSRNAWQLLTRISRKDEERKNDS